MVWQQGWVDRTAHVVPGHKADVAILVSATPADSPAKAFAAPTPGKALEHRGLTALPQGPQVEALQIRTSVSTSRRQVLVDLCRLKAGQAYNLQAQALDADGNFPGDSCFVTTGSLTYEPPPRSHRHRDRRASHGPDHFPPATRRDAFDGEALLPPDRSAPHRL